MEFNRPARPPIFERGVSGPRHLDLHPIHISHDSSAASQSATEGLIPADSNSEAHNSYCLAPRIRGVWASRDPSVSSGMVSRRDKDGTRRKPGDALWD